MGIENTVAVEEKSDLELYLAESEERDVVVPSGYCFVVAGLTKVEFAEILGGLPPMVKSEDDGETDKARQDRANELEQKVYERCVRGIRDRKSGVVHSALPYARVLRNDMEPLIVSAMNRGGLGTAQADQVRRAL